jgi:hypothetical protein
MLTAFTIGTASVVDDGAVSISLTNAQPMIGSPKINGIEIKLVAPHFAHSVSSGPYIVVDSKSVGFVSVPMDGSYSHTHGPNLSVTQWIWKKGSIILATGEKANLILPVGESTISLTVLDSGGNESTDTTTVTVLPYGYPSIASLSPNNGPIAGNQDVSISGSGFTYSTSETTVNFGRTKLTGNEIQIIDANTIKVRSPPIAIGIPVSVSVQTPLGTSAGEIFTYVASSPITFTSSKIIDVGSPTTAVFGPNQKLYVGTQAGEIAMYTLDTTFTKVVSQVIAMVAPNRVILGIAFDPLDAGMLNPPVYCTSSFFFHGNPKSSSGDSINGKVMKVSGANLDVVENIITGLPVSDHDHGKMNCSSTYQM